MSSARNVLLLLATVFLACGFVADVAGKLAGWPRLWTAGGHLLEGGLVAAGTAWILGGFNFRNGRWPLPAAVLVVAAARYLRGSAAVPPDPPLLVAECVSVLLVWLVARRTWVSKRSH